MKEKAFCGCGCTLYVRARCATIHSAKGKRRSIIGSMLGGMKKKKEKQEGQGESVVASDRAEEEQLEWVEKEVCKSLY
jgi:hypothetical protein